MTLERIEELVGLLPPDAPYLARIPRPLSVQGFPPEIDVRAHVLNDPSFGWRFVGNSHLVAVLFRKSDAFADFLKRNPGLCDGLITSWPSVVILWLCVEGPVPRNFNAGPLTWFSDGIVPVAVDERRLAESVVQKGPIPDVQFSGISWDTTTKEGFEHDEMVRLFGAPRGSGSARQSLQTRLTRLTPLTSRQLGTLKDRDFAWEE